MARTAVSPKAFVDAWKTQHYDTIHEAMLKEASRQVNQMVKWMDWHIGNAPEDERELHLEIYGLVRKARNYRTRIYNRTREKKESEFEEIRLTLAGDADGLKDLEARRADWEDDQFVAFRRITKIYCYVNRTVSLEILDNEQVEYEYDPEVS